MFVLTSCPIEAIQPVCTIVTLHGAQMLTPSAYKHHAIMRGCLTKKRVLTGVTELTATTRLLIREVVSFL